MANKYKGEVSIELGGKLYEVLFDWDAIEKAKTELGTQALVKVGILGGMALPELAKLLSIGLIARYPEMTPEKIKSLRPPVYAVQKVCDAALTLAFFGPDGFKEEPEDEKPKSPAAKKKTKARKT